MSGMRKALAAAACALAVATAFAAPSLAYQWKDNTHQSTINDDRSFEFPVVRYRLKDSLGEYNVGGWRYSTSGPNYTQAASANVSAEHAGSGAKFRSMEIAYDAHSETDLQIKVKVIGTDGSESGLITLGSSVQTIAPPSGSDIRGVYLEQWYKGAQVTGGGSNYTVGLNVHTWGDDGSISDSWNWREGRGYQLPWEANYNNEPIDGFNLRILMHTWKVTYNGAYTNGKTFNNSPVLQVDRCYRDTIPAPDATSYDEDGTDVMIPVKQRLATPTGYHVDHDSDNADGHHYVTEAATVTRYFAPNTYSVKYEPNRPANASSAVEGSTPNSSHTYDASSPLSDNGYSLTGWKFAGWNTKADGTGTSYEDGQEVTNLTATNGATVPLYAKWEPITYTVVYDGNGAYEGTTDPTPMVYDVPGTANDNGYGRTGWTFEGWNTKPDGTGADIEPGTEMVNLTTVDGAEVPVYAKWSIDMSMLSFSIPDVIDLRVLPDGSTTAPAGTYVENLSPWPLQVTAIDSAETGSWSITGDIAKENALSLALAPGGVPVNGQLNDTSGNESYLLGTGSGYKELPGYEEGAEREGLKWEATAARVTLPPAIAPAADVTWHVEPRPV